MGRDPELRYTTNGKAALTFTLACNDSWKDKQGNRQESVEWVRLVAWGKQAEVIAEYVKKGTQLYAEGTLKTRKWQDKNGEDRYTTEINLTDFQLLGRAEPQQRKPEQKHEPIDPDEDIPF